MKKIVLLLSLCLFTIAAMAQIGAVKPKEKTWKITSYSEHVGLYEDWKTGESVYSLNVKSDDNHDKVKVTLSLGNHEEAVESVKNLLALYDMQGDVDIFGKQEIYNEDDEIIGTIPYYLTNATEISFDDVYDLVAEYHGIMIPAHIDKTSTSLLSQFGFIPPDSRFTCVEIKDMSHYHALKKQHPYIEKCRIVSNSDAHYLEHIRQPLYTIEVPDKDPKTILKTLATPM